MVKLKISREELHFICNIASPVALEKRILDLVKKQDFESLDFNFTILEIGVMATKKYLFEAKDKYKINLSGAQASAFLVLISTIGNTSEATEWVQFLATKWIGDIHLQLTNYQPKYYGRQRTN
jgi:hypothetical protein